MMKSTLLLLISSSMCGVAFGYTLHFQNNCPFTVWPAVGKAPNGQPDPSVAYGAKLEPGGSSQFGVNDGEIGIRSWGRTGCDGNGANCATGFGNEISWDSPELMALSIVIDTSINNGGNVKTCRQSNCPSDQAFAQPNDFQAVTTSPVGSTFDITFCP
ncbi:uncharacterized protein PGTG_10641 [Puccinia graminis f. sp. tritici CRL 75-36-700-3]|uniref:Osmotin, thaumatin-like protein n=1 Tax=Puccinia graminis f. sp. tritici (strain CRL 75-36-700-3 / race SCCL) TaxID=418459 RepID=E3KIY8_PUCGT|nr:uncharacterized protein PGTG_10641 [Puccinia graminis f. sp. tritici CRL 75-36-700-3]EFP84263.2 hypothetical protein PGTG_10641 [Puccinia graminis f. sp. tritici CRL 75-36-700-3]